MRPRALPFAASISRFVLRNAPTLATSHSPMLVLPVFLVYVVSIGWAIFRPLSLGGLPDVRETFFTFYLVSLAVVAVWLCLPRHFSVPDRYGARNSRLELLDLYLTSTAIGLVMLAPFLAGHLVSARISGMATVPQILADINDVQRAINYPLFRRSPYNVESSIIRSYWGQTAASTESSEEGNRLTSVPGVMPGIDATQRATNNVQATSADVIAADLRRFLEVLRRYSPEACGKVTSGTLTIPTLTSDVLRFDQLNGTRPDTGQISEQEKLQKKYRCISVSAVAFATGQMLLSKGMGVVSPIYTDSSLMQYSLAVAVYSASFVFLMGTLTQRYLLWLAPKLAFLTFLLPGLLSTERILFEGFRFDETYYRIGPVVFRQGTVYVSVAVISMVIVVYYRRYLRKGLTGNARDYVLATVAALPAVLFVAANMYAAFETLFALLLPWLRDANYLPFRWGDETDLLSGAAFLRHLNQQKLVIQALGYAAIPYALILFWLRNWLIMLRSRPGVL